jgi:hypothetical protein
MKFMKWIRNLLRKTWHYFFPAVASVAEARTLDAIPQNTGISDNTISTAAATLIVAFVPGSAKAFVGATIQSVALSATSFLAQHSVPGAASIAVKIAAWSSMAIGTATLTLGASVFFGYLLYALKPWLKGIQPFAQLFDDLHALWEWLASIFNSATPGYGF